MSNPSYYVYALTCDGMIRYIGITSQTLCRRRSQHISDAGRKRANEHKSRWIRKCIGEGKTVEIMPIRRRLVESDAFRIEKQIIAKLRPQLVNIHEGGTSGFNGLSQEAKEKHSAAMQVMAETRDFTSFQKAGCAAHTRSVATKAAASLSALNAELSAPVAASEPLPPWQPDFTLTIECARATTDPRYVMVRCNGKEFGVMSHTKLATMVRKNLRRMSHAPTQSLQTSTPTATSRA